MTLKNQKSKRQIFFLRLLLTTSVLIFILFISLTSTAQSTGSTKNNKYFIEKYGPRFVGNAIYNKSGAAFAIDGEISSIRPLTFYNYVSEKGKRKKKIGFNTFGYSFFQIGYEYNVSTKVNSLRLGVFQLLSPISINPIQLIHQGGESTRGWIYRPEVGFGFWIFQFNYGYNIFLKQELRTQPKHNLIFKIHFPF